MQHRKGDVELHGTAGDVQLAPAMIGLRREQNIGLTAFEFDGIRADRSVDEVIGLAEAPGTGLVDANQEHLEAVAVERLEHLEGRDQRDLMLVGAAATANEHAGLVFLRTHIALRARAWRQYTHEPVARLKKDPASAGSGLGGGRL